MVFKKLFNFHRHISEKCHYDSEGDRFTVPERRMAFMQNAAELIGILQAISIVAKSLAVKLMQIEKDIKEVCVCRPFQPVKDSLLNHHKIESMKKIL